MTYRHVVPVRAEDIDQLDHVSNLVYLRWVLETARAHSAARGWDYPEYEELGAIFIVRRHEIDYLLPVTLGDSVACDTWVEGWRQVSCVRKTTLTRVSDGQIVARAATTWAFVGRGDGKPQRIPDELRALFAEPA